jgi:hypothetical protein
MRDGRLVGLEVAGYNSSKNPRMEANFMEVEVSFSARVEDQNNAGKCG